MLTYRRTGIIERLEERMPYDYLFNANVSITVAGYDPCEFNISSSKIPLTAANVKMTTVIADTNSCGFIFPVQMHETGQPPYVRFYMRDLLKK